MIPLAIRAVADTIRARVASPLFPNTAVEVVLQPKQFSAVCREDYWRRALAGTWQPAHVARCLRLWQDLTLPAVAPGALWYYSPISMVPQGSVPSWVAGRTRVPTPQIDSFYFRFYR
jgi:spore germination cell wall hydrolase CwlJ-like protein